MTIDRYLRMIAGAFVLGPGGAGGPGGSASSCVPIAELQSTTSVGHGRYQSITTSPGKHANHGVIDGLFACGWPI
jgi:hypothetical protein